MVLTSHFEKRVRQRGLNKDIYSLVLEYGTYQGDKVVLDKNAAQACLA